MYSKRSKTKNEFEAELFKIVMPIIEWLDNDEHKSDLHEECGCVDSCNSNTFMECDQGHGYKYDTECVNEDERYEISISRQRFKEQVKWGYKPFYEYKITCRYSNEERKTISMHYLELYDTLKQPEVASRSIVTRKIPYTRKRTCVVN